MTATKYTLSVDGKPQVRTSVLSELIGYLKDKTCLTDWELLGVATASREIRGSDHHIYLVKEELL